MTDRRNYGRVPGGATEDEHLALSATLLGGDRCLWKAYYASRLFHTVVLDPEEEASVAEFVARVVAKADALFGIVVDPGDVRVHLEEAAAESARGDGPLSPAAAVDAEDQRAGRVLAPDDPNRLARIYLRERHHHEHRPTLVSAGDAFMAWDGRRYDEVPDIAKALTASIQVEFTRLNMQEVAAFEAAPGKSRPPTARKVGGRLVADVKQSLAAHVRVAASLDDPSWLIGGVYPAREMVPFPHALLHLPIYAAGEECWLEPTPAFFSTSGGRTSRASARCRSGSDTASPPTPAFRRSS